MGSGASGVASAYLGFCMDTFCLLACIYPEQIMEQLFQGL